MKPVIFAAALAAIFLPHCAAPMSHQPPPPGQTRPPAPKPPSPDDSEPLTAQQKLQVRKILTGYNQASLNAAGARAINDAFRAAGLRRSAALQQAIEEAGFDPRKLSSLAPPPNEPPAGRLQREEDPKPPARKQPRKQSAAPSRGGYSTAQAISDRAQLNTIAFDALAFLTGDLGGNTFLPPGKVSDFFGFQYMRDIDAGELGHNTSFVPRVANNVLHILTSNQKRQLIELAAEQESLIRDFAYKRFPLILAFRRLLDGDLPAGSNGLDRLAVENYSSGLFQIDGLLSYRRAAALGAIIAQFDAGQKSYLAKMLFSDSRTWPNLPDQIDKRSLSPDRHVAVMTYASELFSWYAGSQDADVYFCPERHATYFGSFYMKDIPAMGNPGYSISTQLTGDSGEAFLSVLTPQQRALITGLVELQREPLMDIVNVRRAISGQLRRFISGQPPDKEVVLSLAGQYGRLDGLISFHYASRFAEVNRTLTPEQRRKLELLRGKDSPAPSGAFLYSRAIPMPAIEQTGFLFSLPPGRATAR